MRYRDRCAVRIYSPVAGFGSASEGSLPRLDWSGRGCFLLKSTLPAKILPPICGSISEYAAGVPDAYRLAHQAFGAVMKVTPEVVERIVGLRRLGRRVADIAQLCGLSEPTVKKVLRRVTTKKSVTETQETGTEIDCED